MPMNPFAVRGTSQKWLAPALAGLFALASLPALAADTPDPDAPKGAAVTVLKAAKSCFSNLVEVTGIVLARDETIVRPERAGLKVAEVLADAGDSVSAGQTLARLNLPEGGTAQVAAPIAGLIASSSAVVGAMASAKGEALFSIIALREYDLVGLMAGGQVEIREGVNEGDIVVARAGSLLREGDPVRPVTASGDVK